MIKKIKNIKNQEHHVQRMTKKTLDVIVLDLLLLNYVVSLLKKITRVLTFKDFSKRANFSEDDVFHQKMFSLSNFRQDLGVCFVNAMT